MALPLTVQAQAKAYGINPPHKHTRQGIYYFDASDSGPTEPDGQWSNDSLGFDGATNTYADTTTVGTSSSNNLSAVGTNAPASGGTIESVEFRILSYVQDSSAYLDFEVKHSTETLGTGSHNYASTETWSPHITLTAPTGGWTWAKVQALELNVWKDSGGVNGARLYRAEVWVNISDGDYYFVTGNGSNAIDVEKTSDPSTTASTIQDGTNAPTESPDACLSSISDGTYIHIICIDSTNLSLEYSRFDMSGDTWDITDNQIADLSGMNAPHASVLTGVICLRTITDDEIVVLACGLTDSDMGDPYQRIDLWRSSDSGTPSWTGPVSLHDGDANIELANVSAVCSPERPA